VSFNTAIFYDIENLLKGYSFSSHLISNLSLEEILQRIRKTDRIGQIAVQRAYANWSDPRLGIMRGEINELGIDPIQVFGFSREHKKNAADIQLSIDAIDLAHIRPSIEVYIIVSGDGGFAALAKKLHEYGKTVIGCAYDNAANRTFQAVCDHFVRIADPTEDDRQRLSSSSSVIRPLDGIDPRNARLISHIKRPTSQDPEEVAAKTKEILHWYATDRTCRAELLVGGIHLSVVQQALRQVIPDLQTIRFGFAKFVEYMQYACKDSELCIARIPPSQVVLRLRAAAPSDAEILPDMSLRTAHSIETYQSILSVGSPIYRLPPPHELYIIANWVVKNPMQRVTLAMANEEIVRGLNGAVASEVVKLSLFSFVAAGVFVREPVTVQVSEQRISLHPEVNSIEHVSTILRQAVSRKISAFLTEPVKEEILDQILPNLN
jgi:uncharacterized LabA/DUF88 family protein